MSVALAVGSVCNTYIRMELQCTETAVDEGANTSQITWQLCGYMLTGGTSAYWYSNNYHAISVSINGSTVYTRANTTAALISIGTNHTVSSPFVIANGVLTVPHNRDGSKTMPMSFTCAYRWGGGFTWSGSGNLVLTQVPVASTIAVSSSSIADSGIQTITITAASVDYTHKLYYQTGNSSLIELPSSVSRPGENSLGMNYIAGTAYMNNPNTLSATVNLYVETYNMDDTLLGTNSTSFTLTFTESTVEPYVTIDISDLARTQDGAYAFLQNRCAPKVDVVAAPRYNSTITSIVVETSEGQSWTGTGTPDSTYPTTKKCTIYPKVVTTSGFYTITVTATNSRGVSKTATRSVTIVAYEYPSFTIDELYRCVSASDSTADDEGQYAALTISGEITTFTGGGNVKVFNLYYKAVNSSTWISGGTIEPSAYSFSGETFILQTALDVNTSYDFKLTITDMSATERVVTAILSTATGFANIGATAIAFGKKLESGLDTETIDSAWKFISRDDVYAGYGTSDQVSLIGLTEAPSAYDSYYDVKQFGNGYAMVFYRQTFNLACTQGFGNIYMCATPIVIGPPVQTVSKILSAQVMCHYNAGLVWATGLEINDANQYVRVYIASAQSVTADITLNATIWVAL